MRPIDTNLESPGRWLPRYGSLVGIWLLLALLSLGAPVAAQEAEQTGGEEAAAEDEGPYFETVNVNVVNLDVWVTGKKGEPLMDLTRDDFEVFEDGRAVPISNFTAFEPVEVDRSVNAQAAREAALARGEELTPDLAALEQAEDRRLHLVIYIDNYNIRPFNRNRVFRRLRAFVNDTIRDGDRVMLASYDRSLHIRHPFTTDPNQIAAGLFELEEVSGHAVHYDSERRDLLREIEEAENLGEVSYRVRTFAESRFNDLAFTIDSLQEIVDSLAGLKGRKAIIYVSDGLPMTPGEDLFYAIHQKFQTSAVLTQARDYDASGRFQTVASRANSNQVMRWRRKVKY